MTFSGLFIVDFEPNFEHCSVFLLLTYNKKIPGGLANELLLFSSLLLV